MKKRILYLGLDPSHYKAEGEIFHLPLIEIIPTPLTDPSLRHALIQFEDYSHVIFTSKSTVKILLDHLLALDISFSHWMQKQIISVGKVTASHLEKAGIKTTHVAQEETAEGVIDLLKQLPLKNAHLFWPHSLQARPILHDFLISQPILFTSCPLYAPYPRSVDFLPSLEDFDEIVFTSPSVVDAFLMNFTKFPAHAHLIPIGPVTARYLTQRIVSLPN